ncbi:MAG: hypothetical protein JST16_19050 [Bdellovibrionales bacterium]|nr:hypothetical protein [Bdellovibrionales bacterium]
MSIYSKPEKLSNLLKLLIITTLVACASKHTPPPLTDEEIGQNAATNQVSANPAPTLKADSVAPGYLIQIAHPEDKTLNGKFRIEFDGTLKLPYGKKIDTKGLEFPALEKRILDTYASYFKSGENLFKIQVVQKKLYLDVRGPFTKPGLQLIDSRTSIDEIIAAAGGLEPQKGIRFVRINQGEHTTLVNLENYFRSSSSVTVPNWIGGDVLFFQKDDGGGPAQNTGTIRLLGEVRTPGDLGFQSGRDFYYYYSEAGGPTNQADIDVVELIRGKDSQRITYVFSLKDRESIPHLQAGDILVLHADKRGPWERGIQYATGVSSVIIAIAALVVVF